MESRLIADADNEDELFAEERLKLDRTFYYGKSKEYYHCDPNVDDPSSIQNASCYTVYLLLKSKDSGEWVFPTMAMPQYQTFDLMKDDLRDDFCKKDMLIQFVKRFPSASSIEKFTREDLDNSSLCRRLNGRKVFYYEAYHESGEVQLNPKYYTEQAWVPIPHLSRYLTVEQWNKYRPLLPLI